MRNKTHRPCYYKLNKRKTCLSTIIEMADWNNFKHTALKS